MKKFEPQYRLVRVGLATKAERASRQQRAYPSSLVPGVFRAPGGFWWDEDGGLTTSQASSARTGKRPSAVPRRPRARRRRRSKRRPLVRTPHPPPLYSRYPGWILVDAARKLYRSYMCLLHVFGFTSCGGLCITKANTTKRGRVSTVEGRKKEGKDGGNGCSVFFTPFSVS